MVTNRNVFKPTIVEGPRNSFSGIGGSVNPLPGLNSSPAASAPKGTIPSAAGSGGGIASLLGIGVSGIGQLNNDGGGVVNSGIGNQFNGNGPINYGAGAGSVNIKSKYEEAREMAVTVSAAVTSALRFKEGAHSEITDSRVLKVDEILDYLSTMEYEECKRGNGGSDSVKVIDGLIRSQFKKTNVINFHKSKDAIDPKQFRFMGFLTGVQAVNDAAMENVVYAVGEKAMEHGATDVVKVKESATEWGDTTGYAFDLGGFVTSILGGAGSRSIGPGGSAAVGVNGMKGGSADRSDVKFAVFVSNEWLQKTSQEFQKK
jgi:hypothetical protein